MRALVQRVSQAKVEVEGQTIGQIAQGLLVLVGVTHDDNPAKCRWLADKVANLRIFEDEAGKMNRSVLDQGGAILAVSQFTLYGDARRGRRPSFTEAAPPEAANALYELFCDQLRETGLTVETGQFQADMAVSLTNDGPVTLLVETPPAQR
ncbi:D-aminoacyl-tRNA deacylase [Peptococcus simiae]|uniref:D-aminoacyl-tRNA deacylase n=1 Tax=Peptococcus simiae TaxID=1643805 RepID=UPI00397F8337